MANEWTTLTSDGIERESVCLRTDLYFVLLLQQLKHVGAQDAVGDHGCDQHHVGEQAGEYGPYVGDDSGAPIRLHLLFLHGATETRPASLASAPVCF